MLHFSFTFWSFFGLFVSEGRAFDTSPSDISLGQASHIHPDSFSSIRYQPASLVLVPKYQVGAGIGMTIPEFTWGFGVGAVDSNQGPLTLGVLYDRQIQSNEDPQNLPGWKLPNEEISLTETTTTLGGASAISFAERRFSLGSSLLYHTNSTPSQLEQRYEWNLSGAVFCLAEQVLMGIALQNLLPEDLDKKETIIEGSFRWGPLNPMLLNKTIYDGSPFRSYGGFEVDISTNTSLELQHIGMSADIRMDLISVRGGATWKPQFDDPWTYGTGLGLMLKIQLLNMLYYYILPIQKPIKVTLSVSNFDCRYQKEHDG